MRLTVPLCFLLSNSLAHSDGVTALQLRGFFEKMAFLAATNQMSQEKSSPPAAAALEAPGTTAAPSTDQPTTEEEEEEEDIYEKSVQIALDVKGISLALDLREGVLETLLVLLELPPFSMVKVS